MVRAVWVGIVDGVGCVVIIVVGVGVADGRHDGDVAVVWVVVGPRDAG